ncbi:hypothetical protein PspLS_11341 [Pyricularia sp. CBS 133598]|nr:hypothetical protein PspLS_11341 [Pyricularia sp. CBS 133598]
MKFSVISALLLFGSVGSCMPTVASNIPKRDQTDARLDRRAGTRGVPASVPRLANARVPAAVPAKQPLAAPKNLPGSARGGQRPQSQGVLAAAPAGRVVPGATKAPAKLPPAGTKCKRTGGGACALPFRPLTVSQCKAHLDSTYGSKLLFWSRVGGLAKAATRDAKTYPFLQGYKVMRDIFIPLTYQQDYMKSVPNDKQEVADTNFWDVCSQALALVATGKVYVMLPEGSGNGLNWADRGDSHWATLEFPILCRNPAVTELWRLSDKKNVAPVDLTAHMLQLRTARKCPPQPALS